MSASDATQRNQYLSFTLAGSDYAVGILQVREILQYETVTRVPSVPPSIRGVINLRGAVVPVLDLALKFGLEATPVTKRTCVLIVDASVGGESTVVGVMADAVREVLELGGDEVEPPPSFGTQVRVDYLVGMGKAGKGFVLLLDLDRVISAGERELAAQLGGEGGAPAGALAAGGSAPAAGEALVP
ncbi:chemotaxis protein CheW [Anaeromyxobacter diazotrophicus]|uniref:Chemotaxis protein CheW n=1 Tax=Anaeromyxobacter diazotrophicus TaxID=2590199 RepID=A0A7I9VQJ8_9BACT|nr:chemotaxis protein CheW [Anaeromyxobacter diazotrophicus]GEJ58400.1 chemotaxis protein CheW [Anaeromyxobacter diazotrophicus]